MKITAAILLFILLGDCFFYSSFFDISFIVSKITAIIKLAALKEDCHGCQTPLLRIAVNNLDKDQEDEVWYHGALYDVVKRETNGNTNFVYLLADDVEQDLIAQNYNYFQTGIDLLSKANFIHPENHKANKLLTEHQYIRCKKRKISFFTGIILICDTEYKYSSTSAYKIIPSPPPKISSLLYLI